MSSVLNKIKETRHYISNWPDVIQYRLGLRSKLDIYFRNLDGNSVYKEPVRVSKSDNSMKINYNGKELVFYYDGWGQLSNSGLLIRGQFLDEEYKWLNPNGEFVIDIGANVGDSAIYFALQGARKVYAFEPYPYSCEIANRNVKSNALEDKIEIVNEGCAGTPGAMKINSKTYNNGASSLEGSEQGIEVKIVTLDNIVSRLALDSYILKVDCEGCEVDIFANVSDATLKKCKKTIIEYHNGDPSKIVEKLKGVGFSTTVKPNGDKLGLIFAEK